MGLLPRTSPRGVYASEYYKRDFLKFNERFGSTDFEFKSLAPKLYLPCFLQERLKYSTHAMVSLPVINPKTILNQGFDSYRLMDKHNDMRAMVKAMRFSDERPSFYLLNVRRNPLSLRAARRTARRMAAHQRSAWSTSSTWTTRLSAGNW